MPELDSLDRLALDLGQRNSLAAYNHAHRARNHLDRLDEALEPLLDVSDLRDELRRLRLQLSDFHSRIELRFQSNARRFGGPKVRDSEVAHELIKRPLRRAQTPKKKTAEEVRPRPSASEPFDSAQRPREPNTGL